MNLYEQRQAEVAEAIEERNARLRAIIGWLQNVLDSPASEATYPSVDTALEGAKEWANDTWRDYR